MIENRGKKNSIIFAAWISIITNAILAVLKLTIGFISGSFAVVADGIDSAVDILSSIVTLVAARVVIRPPNIRFPYGYIKADTIATKVLSLLIIVAGIQLLIATIGSLINPADSRIPEMIAVYVTLFSMAGKLGLSMYLKATGKNNNSQMLRTMGIHMRNDMLISFSVLVGLLLSRILELPVIDSLFAFFIGIFIIYEAVRIFLKSNTELMDGIDHPGLYEKIFESVNAVDGASHPHRTRARKIGNYFMINLDIEVDPGISVREAHEIARKVEIQIRDNVEKVYDIMVHIEPRGNVEKDEKFGVSEKDIL